MSYLSHVHKETEMSSNSIGEPVVSLVRESKCGPCLWGSETTDRDTKTDYDTLVEITCKLSMSPIAVVCQSVALLTSVIRLPNSTHLVPGTLDRDTCG